MRLKKCKGTIMLWMVGLLVFQLIGGLPLNAVVRAETAPVVDQKIPKFRADGRPNYVEGEIVVKYKQNGRMRSSMRMNSTFAIESQESLGVKGAELVKVESGQSIDEAITSLKSSGTVEFAQPNYLYYPQVIPTVSDSSWGQLWGLHNTGQSVNGTVGIADVDIDALEAWEYTNLQDEIIVAVIDTGVDITHPDLVGKIWTNPNDTMDDQDNDGNQLVDDVHGWDFANNDNSVFDHAEYDTHGTHVAGTIAAAANAIGVRGVASNVKIMPLKFIDSSGAGSTSNAIKAIEYAIANGAKVINASWGSEANDLALKNAITNSGVLFVAAAGNRTVGANNDVTPIYPASFTSSNIISVAAVDNRGRLASFSNYGALSVDVGAPGVGIYSTFPSSNYAFANGTSMAAPHVAGIAASLFGEKNLTVNEIIELIKSSGTALAELSGKTVTGRMVNIYNSLVTQVSNAAVTLSNQWQAMTSGYTVAFQTGVYGKLIPGDQITMVFPAGTVVPSAISADKILVNGIASGTSAQFVEVSGQSITLHVPAEIGHSTKVSVAINSSAKIVNPLVGSAHRISVSTTADPLPLLSSNYSINFALYSSGKSYTTAFLFWKAPTDATSIVIEQSTDGGAQWTQAIYDSLAPSARSTTVKALTPSTSYKFRMVVTGGMQPGVSELDAVTTDAVPFAIADLASSSSTDSTATFSWTGVTGASVLVLEQLIDDGQGGSIWEKATTALLSPTASSVTATGLLSATTYLFRLSMLSSHYQKSSNIVSVTTNVAPIVPVANLTAGVVTDTTTAFTWHAPIGATAVDLLKSANDGLTWESASTNSPNLLGATTANVTFLLPNMTYLFRLHVTGGVNAGFSNVVVSRTLPYSGLVALNPKLIGARALSNTSVELLFDQPLLISSVGLVSQYTVSENFSNQVADSITVNGQGVDSINVNSQNVDSLNTSSGVVTVESAKLGIDAAKVILTVSPMADFDYSIVVSNTLLGLNGETVDSLIVNRTAKFHGALAGSSVGPISAFVDGTRLELQFAEPLDGKVLPVVGDFSVLKDGQHAAVSSVAIHGNKLILILNAAVTEGQVVLVSYNRTNNQAPLVVYSSGRVVSFAGISVTNRVGQLEVSSAMALSNTVVEVTFNHAVSAAAVDNFSIVGGVSAPTVLSAVIQSETKKVRLTIDSMQEGSLYEVTAAGVSLGKFVRTDRDRAVFVSMGTASLAYTSNRFIESNGNDGSIVTTIGVTLSGTAGEKFSGVTGDDFISTSKVLFANVPAGLTSVVTLTSNMTASISLSGSASAHTNTNDISNLEIIFTDAAFVGGNAFRVNNATKSDFVVDYADPVPTPAPTPTPSPISTATPTPTPSPIPVFLGGGGGGGGGAPVPAPLPAPAPAPVPAPVVPVPSPPIASPSSTPIATPTSLPTPSSTPQSATTPQPKQVAEPDGSYRLFDSSVAVTKGVNTSGNGVTIVKPEADKLQQTITAAGQGQQQSVPRVVIKLPETKESVRVELSTSAMQEGEKKSPGTILDIRNDYVSFQLPIQILENAFAIKGTRVQSADPKVTLTMEPVRGASADLIGTIAANSRAQLVGPIIDFRLHVESGGNNREVRDFNGTYVTRSISLSQGIDPAKTTGALYDPITKQLSFIPSMIDTSTGKTIVRMTSPHNSIYTVVSMDKSFTDLQGHWARGDIEMLANKLVVRGKTEHQFVPDAMITRAEFASLLVRALGLEEESPELGASRFTDVLAANWFAGAIGTAAKAGLVSGYADLTFAPQAPITREQMAVMIVRALSYIGMEIVVSGKEPTLVLRFSDKGDISAWAEDSVAKVLDAQIVQGLTESTFAPAAQATRAQATVMLKRLLKHARFIN